MLNPIIDLIATLLNLYSYVVIIWAVISLLIFFEIINRFSPLVQKINYVLTRLVEPGLRPIRRVLSRILPDLGGVDLSPLFLIILLQFAQNVLYHYFYNW